MKIINILLTTALFVITANAQDVNLVNSTMKEVRKVNSVIQPYYQGTVIETLNAKGYTYLLINEKISISKQEELKSFWIAVTRTEAKVGDYVRFKKELVMKDYSSKILNKTFKELMFASGLEYRVSK